MNLSSIFHNYIFLFPAILYRKYQVVHLRKYLKFHIFFQIIQIRLSKIGFPFRNRLSRYPQFFCYRFLRKSLLSPQLPQFFSQQTPSRLSVLVKSIFIKTFIWIFVKNPAVSFTQPFVAFGCTFRICCFKVFFCHTPFIRTETSL